MCFHVTFGYVWTRLQLWSSRKFKVYLILNKIVSQWQSYIFEFWWRYRLRNISHTSISALSQAQRRRSRMNNMWRFWLSGLLKLCLRKIIFEWFRFKQLSKHIYYYLVLYQDFRSINYDFTFTRIHLLYTSKYMEWETNIQIMCTNWQAVKYRRWWE